MFLTNHKLNLFMFTFFFFLVFSILNLFFYSFITISLYKLICYDSNNINIFLTLGIVNKLVHVLYIVPSLLNIVLVVNNNAFYNLFFFDFFSTLSNLYFYDLIANYDISSYFFTNSYTSVFYDDDSSLIFLNFFIRSSNLNWIQALSLQKTIILNLNESGLFFFRIYNPSHLNVKLITLYMIYPNIITLYVNKIQCFCFNVIFLYPLELVDLPVLIYIHPFFSLLDNVYINNIIIYYIIFLN